MIRVADYVMQSLCEKGIERVFVITGRGILFLTDALAKNKGLKSVSMHNEQALSYAAYAYARVHDGYGVALVSTGCASTNCITGVLNAWQDHVPIVFISGNNPLAENTRHTKLPIRTYGSQEADIISIVQPITKYAVMVSDSSKIALELEKAFYIANEGVKGPVWIDIPLDIQDKRIDENNLEHFVENSDKCAKPSKTDIDYIVECLFESKRPLCLIGSGVKDAGAVQELKSFVEKNDVPVVYAPSAVDVYPSSLPLSVGCVSSLGGSREANFAVQNADLLLILGCRMPSMLTGGEYDKFAHSAKKILVDTDEYEPKKGNIVYDRIVNADLKIVLAGLNKKCIKRAPLEWVEKCVHWKDSLSLGNAKYTNDEPVDLYNLAGKFSEHLPDNAVLITDAGFEELIIPSNTAFKEKQRCVHPFMQGSMGFALPAVIGASIAKTDCQIVAVIGDGSIMMNLQEFQTILKYKIPAKIIVVNNNMYAVIRKRQKDLFRTRTIGTDSSNGVDSPNWEKVADCFGLEYMKIASNGELSEKLSKLFSMNCAVICEIIAVEEQPYLHTSFARNEQGVFEHRPMEDQAPFLDREFFNAEMIQDNRCVEN